MRENSQIDHLNISCDSSETSQKEVYRIPRIHLKLK